MAEEREVKIKSVMSTLVFLPIVLVLCRTDDAHAQDQFKRAEASLAMGRHVEINALDDFGLHDNKMYLAGHLLYNFSATQSIGVRFGRTAHPRIEWFATYRYNWRQRQPTRIYFEVGLGANEPLESFFNKGMRFSMAFAVGIKRFLGEHWSLSLESRGVGFTQKKDPFTDEIVTVHILSFALGYLF